MNVLLEGVPEGIGLAEVEAALNATPGVAAIHDLHIWALSTDKVSATVHIVCEQPDVDWQDLLNRVRATLATQFSIHHTTIQIERTPCSQGAARHSFDPDAGTPQ